MRRRSAMSDHHERVSPDEDYPEPDDPAVLRARHEAQRKVLLARPPGAGNHRHDCATWEERLAVDALIDEHGKARTAKMLRTNSHTLRKFTLDATSFEGVQEHTAKRIRKELASPRRTTGSAQRPKVDDHDPLAGFLTPPPRPHFVQIAACASGEGGTDLYALDDRGDVYSHINHYRHGLGWYRVQGDDKRRRDTR
jgi:hypothetical protein